jgi:uncharacterized protein YndB with AHSA1/START domain
MTTEEFTTNLARFEDPWTMRHTRVYPHPIARVWEAVTTTEHVNRWLLPTAVVSAVEGATCSFTWGGPPGGEQYGVVRSVSPPTGIVYDLDTSYLRFELEAVDDSSTRLVLVHGFTPGAHVEPQDWEGGDQPAGPDSPWRPGFSQGFHVMLDALAIALDGASPADENVLAWLRRTGGNDPDQIARRVEIYRQHIAEEARA